MSLNGKYTTVEMDEKKSNAKNELEQSFNVHFWILASIFLVAALGASVAEAVGEYVYEAAVGAAFGAAAGVAAGAAAKDGARAATGVPARGVAIAAAGATAGATAGAIAGTLVVAPVIAVVAPLTQAAAYEPTIAVTVIAVATALFDAAVGSVVGVVVGAVVGAVVEKVHVAAGGACGVAALGGKAVKLGLAYVAGVLLGAAAATIGAVVGVAFEEAIVPAGGTTAGTVGAVGTAVGVAIGAAAGAAAGAVGAPAGAIAGAAVAAAARTVGATVGTAAGAAIGATAGAVGAAGGATPVAVEAAVRRATVAAVAAVTVAVAIAPMGTASISPFGVSLLATLGIAIGAVVAEFGTVSAVASGAAVGAAFGMAAGAAVATAKAIVLVIYAVGAAVGLIAVTLGTAIGAATQGALGAKFLVFGTTVGATVGALRAIIRTPFVATVDPTYVSVAAAISEEAETFLTAVAGGAVTIGLVVALASVVATERTLPEGFLEATVLDSPGIPAEAENKHDEIHQDKLSSWFEDTFLDNKRKLKKEIHQELRSFSWLRGAYGLTGPNKKICRPHLYVTVKRGVAKSYVRRELEDRFECDAKKYFELLKEPERKPKVKYLVGDQGKLRGSNTDVSASVKPVPGGGVLACISSTPNPPQVPEEIKGDDEFGVGGKGTLTLFCSLNGHHYALTCFHVACANEQSCFNATFHKIENVIQSIRNSLECYEVYAKAQQFYFIERESVQNNNEIIAFGDNSSRKSSLGTFEKYHFDNECDILSVKIADGVDVECKVADATSPKWNKIWHELNDRVVNKIGLYPVQVEKTGFSSGLTHGRIIEYNFSYLDGANLLYQDAIVIKGCPNPFLKDGDSGSLVFFRDSEDQKQVFAYGVCEVDELTLPVAHDVTGVDDDASDASSIWSEDEALGSSDEDEIESEDEKKNETVEQLEYKTKYIDKWEHECEERHTDGSDDDKCEQGNGLDDKDDFITFQKEGETKVWNATPTGPYYICLRLDTALEKLGLEGTACFNDCGSK